MSRSVKRYAGGVHIPLRPYLDHPMSFWRLALKEIMHLQHRWLVREASARSFLERLQRRRRLGLTPHEWVELRKGAASRLTATEELIVLKTGYLMGVEEEVDWPDSWLDFAVDFDRCTSAQVCDDIGRPIAGTLTCGSWTVTYHTTSVTDEMKEALKRKNYRIDIPGVAEGEEQVLLGGSFTYALPLLWPNCRLIPMTRVLEGCSECVAAESSALSRFAQNEFIANALCRGKDRRLRHGLPLLTLVPCKSLEGETGAISAFGEASYGNIDDVICEYLSLDKEGLALQLNIEFNGDRGTD